MLRYFLPILGLFGFYRVASAAGLYICNESGEVINVAYGRLEGDLWVSSGWTSIALYGCYPMTTNFTNSRYYVYAVGTTSGKLWGGSHAFCVKMSEGFVFNGSDYTGCEARGFFSVWIPDMVTGEYPDHYAVVIGPNTFGLDHPRAER